MNLIAKFKEGFDEAIKLRYSQACRVMFDGGEVYLPDDPGIIYSFDGAEGYRVWTYSEYSDELTHIDNVPFDKMMRDDWKVHSWGRRGRSIAIWHSMFGNRRSHAHVLIFAIWFLAMQQALTWWHWLLGLIAYMIVCAIHDQIKKKLVNGKDV